MQRDRRPAQYHGVLIVRLDHLDATIRLFDLNADVDTMPNRAPPRLAAFRGEMRRTILESASR
jgi:hypothetical protein